MSLDNSEKRALKLVIDVESRRFVALDDRIADLAGILAGGFVEQSISKEGVLLKPVSTVAIGQAKTAEMQECATT